MDTPTDPRPDDEPSVQVMLFGRNNIVSDRMNGWTHSFPVTPGPPVGSTITGQLRSIKTIQVSALEGEAPELAAFKRAFESYRPLKEVTEFIAKAGGSMKIPSAVFVQVLAKKEVSMIVLQPSNSVMTFGQLIVGDESGFCPMKVVNSGIHTIYNRLEIGDRLLINGATLVGAKDYDDCSLLGSGNIKVVIKASEINIYQICKVVDEVSGLVPLLEYIVDERVLWRPSSFNSRPQELKPPSDIIGVVSHMSRLERFRRYESKVKLDDGSERDLAQFRVFCWIELIDKTSSKPVPIHLNMGNLLWDKQLELLPGAVVVVTHVARGLDYDFQHLCSTYCSEIYVNDDIVDYFALMRKKDSFMNEAREIVLRQNATEILSRTDVTWSIGGTYSRPFRCQEEFIEARELIAEENPEKLWPKIPELPLCRRETQFIAFKGVILRYKRISSEWDCHFDEWDDTNGEFTRGELNPPNRNLGKIYDPVPVSAKDTSLWSIFTRKLPAINLDELPIPGSAREFSRPAHLFKEASKKYEKYAGTLRMPAEGVAKKLKKLPAIDGTPHFAVDIYNMETGQKSFQRHIFTWKPSQDLTIEQMDRKLCGLMNKGVLVLYCLHRTESMDIKSKFGHQFVIKDIVELERRPDEPMDEEE